MAAVAVAVAVAVAEAEAEAESGEYQIVKYSLLLAHLLGQPTEVACVASTMLTATRACRVLQVGRSQHCLLG